MKKIFVFVLTFLLIPTLGMCFQTGPKSQSNFGNKKSGGETAAATANSKTRSLSTYGTGRSWDRSVQTQGVQTQGVQTQVAGQAKEKKKDQEGFVDPSEAQLSGLQGKLANTNAGGKSAAAPQGKGAAEGKDTKAEPAKADASQEQAAGMPAGMDAIMQQMGQMQNMMSMMGAMGGAGGAQGAAGGAQGAAGAAGGMPAGMPDMSALMGGLGGMGGGAPKK